MTAAVAAFAGIYTYWRFWPNSRMRRRVTDVRALHDLLVHHIDDLEDVMAALRNSYGPCSGMLNRPIGQRVHLVVVTFFRNSKSKMHLFGKCHGVSL